MDNVIERCRLLLFAGQSLLACLLWGEGPIVEMNYAHGRHYPANGYDIPLIVFILLHTYIPSRHDR